MGIAPEDKRTSAYDRFRQQTEEFFNAQLERIGLSTSQIAEQQIPELEDSLVRVDDALRAPESFGVLKLSMSASGAAFIVKSNTESIVEIGIVPLLLERKKVIIDRLRNLRSKRTIKTLEELIDSISDSGLREQMRTELEATRQTISAIASSCKVQQGTAFIAMAMDPQEPQLEDVLDAIKEGSERCGIIAERIDEAVSNEPITARMLSAIEEAEFVVVDLTKPRPNVYYEAGYAQGLGKTPVYVARQGTEIPFDIKDYPVILYPNMRELKALLAERLTSVSVARKKT